MNKFALFKRRARRPRTRPRSPLAYKAASLVLPTALAATLLSAAPAVAEEEQLDPQVARFWARAAVVNYWQQGGEGVKRSAERALLGTDQDVEAFHSTVAQTEFADDSVAATRMMAVGGPGVRKAALKALDTNTPEALSTFLLSGWQGPLDADRQVEITRIVNSGGVGVREAGIAALDGTREDREKFLADGQYIAQQADDQVEATQIYSKGGPNVKAAALLALDGTPSDVSEFLALGQHVARNRDQEHLTISQLTHQAKQAGKQAEDATKGAQEAADAAVEASQTAKDLAAQAAAQTEDAKDDAEVASAKAQVAADAARAAGLAAQQAITSANAANRAARTAAFAAAQTAAAATAAADAANKAYIAAIAAGQDAAKSAEAKTAAATALMAATLAEGSALAAEMAGKASAAAATAVRAAASAGDNANAAAQSADAAADSAAAAGGYAGDARAAAREARGHASAANAAANSAALLADKSATAAFEARTAANNAATHARNAAAAAELAVEHAGEASSQAAIANEHAAAAKKAWETADAAAKSAKTTFDLARQAEANELSARNKGGIEQVNTRRSLMYGAVSGLAKAEADRRALNTAAANLAAEAGNPATDPASLAARGRKFALQVLGLSTPISQDAAARALAGTDQDIIEYLRSGWREAEQREMRERVVQLTYLSPYPSVRTAATEALKGTLDQVEAFYSTGQYTVGAADMAVAVTAIHDKGGVGVKEAALAALDDGSGKALARFLEVTQYSARFADESVTATQLYSSSGSGPEVKSAAEIALVGTAEDIHQFVTVGRYTADRKDKLTKQHEAQVQRLVSEASLVAATANKNRWLAAAAAAKANKADDDATAAANQATASAEEADGYAAAADAAADEAETSAAEAKQSATTARNAANRADADADAAEASATRAEASAAHAQKSAAAAGDAAAEARASALEAGLNAEDAKEMATSAWKEVKIELEKEIAAELKKAEEARQNEKNENLRDRQNNSENCLVVIPRATHWENCEKLEKQNEQTREFLKGLWGFTWSASGGEDIQKCIQDPAIAGCALAIIGILPWGKIKLLKKVGDEIEEIANGFRKKKDGKVEIPDCPTLPRQSLSSQTSYITQAAYSTADDFPPIFCDRDAELEALGPFTGKTRGRAKSSDNRKWDEDILESGHQMRDAELIDWVNKKVVSEGITTGYKVWSRFHVETKFVAIMATSKPKVTNADLVINKPEGPCPEKLGCDDILSRLLNGVGTLRVHWKDSDNVWHSEQYPKAG
ncbi:DddA-like double-stranded DNA deaminase toxin [Streptomyces hydrogenans]